jgi:hypothetical protein
MAVLLEIDAISIKKAAIGIILRQNEPSED